MDSPLMGEGAAPATRLCRFSPIFPVRDLRRALAHYASLGFEVKAVNTAVFAFLGGSVCRG